MAALGLHLLLGLSLAETSGGCPLVVEHGLTCPAACGIFPGRGSNLCLLWWPAEAYPLSHLGNLVAFFFFKLAVPGLSCNVQDLVP